MGTRHLIKVKIDGQVKIAQYGQWDGYLEGQGVGIATFLHEQMRLEDFKEALRKCSFYSEEELEALAKTDWKSTHPWLSRELGSDILSWVQDKNVTRLVDHSDFQGSSSCEYCYTIDMDSQTVTVNSWPATVFADWTAENLLPKALQENKA